MKKNSIILLFFIVLISCYSNDYEDYALSYSKLPFKVQREFDSIFNSINTDFVILSSLKKGDSCYFEFKSKFIVSSEIDLFFAQKKVTVPVDISAVRIFVTHDKKLYYIKSDFFARENDAKIKKHFDYKNHVFSVYNL